MEEIILKAVGSIGIPAAIALYVLIVLNRTIEELKDSLNLNTQVLAVLLTKLDCDDEVQELLGLVPKYTHSNGVKK